jgi:hypothetical protein
MTVDEMAELELAYVPPFSSAKDPVNLAGMVAQNVLNDDVKIIQWHELAVLDPNSTLALDVRDDAERLEGWIPGSVICCPSAAVAP